MISSPAGSFFFIRSPDFFCRRVNKPNEENFSKRLQQKCECWRQVREFYCSVEDFRFPHRSWVVGDSVLPCRRVCVFRILGGSTYETSGNRKSMIQRHIPKDSDSYTSFLLELKSNIRKSKQDRQCTYNVTLERVRVTVVAVEKY